MRTHKRKRLKEFWGINAYGWITVAVAFGMGVNLDRVTGTNRWHAPIVWTTASFSGAILLAESKWRRPRFWIYLSFWFGVHLLLIWYLFGRLLPNFRVGTLLVIPIGFMEGVVLPVLAMRLGTVLRLPVDEPREHAQPTQR